MCSLLILQFKIPFASKMPPLYKRKILSCRKCGRRYGLQQAFRKHLDTCGKNKEIPCPDVWCPKLFRTKERAEFHYEHEHSINQTVKKKQTEDETSCITFPPNTEYINIREPTETSTISTMNQRARNGDIQIEIPNTEYRPRETPTYQTAVCRRTTTTTTMASGETTITTEEFWEFY